VVWQSARPALNLPLNEEFIGSFAGDFKIVIANIWLYLVVSGCIWLYLVLKDVLLLFTSA